MTQGDPDLFFDVAPTTDNGEAIKAQTPLPTAVDEAINGRSEEVNTIEALQGIRAQASCTYQGSPDPLVMNTTTQDVLTVTSFGHWI